MVIPKKYKVHVVAGPTASGKTDYAIKLAQREHGELINIDSRQIYKYLDIGTNKGHLKYKGEIELSGQSYPYYEIDRSDVYIYLIDFLVPDKLFNAFEFRELVYELIPKITAQGFVPILVGGTGLYLDMILNPDHYDRVQREVDHNERKRLNNLTLTELQQELIQLDPTVYKDLNSSDQHNPRRLIRQIEILRNFQPQEPYVPPIELESQIHYVDIELSKLTEKIDRRVEKMFKQGLIEEVKKVLKLGFPEEITPLQGIGYKQVIAHLKGEMTLEQAIERTKIDHRQYAKRQITWFKKYLS